MSRPASISIVEATADHFEAIEAIERASGPGSPVTLAGAEALGQAIERGHWIAVAMDGDAVAGWIWFSVEIDRGGEYAGQIFRIAVVGGSRRTGVGSALLEHARGVFNERSVGCVRITVDANDDDARGFFEASGFAPGTLTMVAPL